MIFYSLEVLVTLTTDVGRVLSKLHHVQAKGKANFATGIKIAHVSWTLKYLSFYVHNIVELKLIKK